MSNYRVDTEEGLQRKVCQYIRLQYPHVMFRSDLGGVRLTPGLRARSANLQSGRAWPDLFIAQPVSPWYGLFVELKKEGSVVYLRTGHLSANLHIQEQAAALTRLGANGYLAVFAIGFDQAKQVIDDYLGGE